MDGYDVASGGLLGGSKRGPTDMAAYEKAVKWATDLAKAQQLAYAPGDATEADWAALGVSPEARAQATKEDLQTSHDRANYNFSSNMMPLAMIAAAYGVDATGLLGGGGAATGAAAGGSASDAALSALANGSWASDPAIAGILSGGNAGSAGLLGAAADAGGGDVAAGTLGEGAPGLLGPSVTDPAGLAALESQAAAAGGGGLLGGAGSGGGALMPGDLASYESGLAGQTANAGTSLSGILDSLSSGKGLATLAGGLLGGLAGSQGQTASQTSTKEPWGPAQPWIKDNIATGQGLQQYYQQNPFNAQQKTGMQNTLSDTDNYRANILPGLLSMANGMSTGQYQRQKGGAPGSGGGYGGLLTPGGYTPGASGPFSAPAGGLFGQIQWDAINPFAKKA